MSKNCRPFVNRLRSFAFELQNEPVHDPVLFISADGQHQLIDPLSDDRSKFTWDMFRVENLIENGVDLSLVGSIGPSSLDLAESLDYAIPYIESNSQKINSQLNLNVESKSE